MTRTAARGDPSDEAFRHALEAERLRNARRLNGLRFLGVSLFLGVVLLMVWGVRRPTWEEQNWPLFLAYWSGSGIAFLLGRRFARVARLAAIAIPVVDMPAVFFPTSARRAARRRRPSSGRREIVIRRRATIFPH